MSRFGCGCWPSESRYCAACAVERDAAAYHAKEQYKAAQSLERAHAAAAEEHAAADAPCTITRKEAINHRWAMEDGLDTHCKACGQFYLGCDCRGLQSWHVPGSWAYLGDTPDDAADGTPDDTPEDLQGYEFCPAEDCKWANDNIAVGAWRRAKVAKYAAGAGSKRDSKPASYRHGNGHN